MEAVDVIRASLVSPRDTPGTIKHEYRAGGQGMRARLVRIGCRFLLKPILLLWPLRGPLARLMWVPDFLFGLLPRLRSTEHSRVSTSTWRGEYVRPRSARTGRGAILYLHGGAFVFCGLGTHRRIVERLALGSGLPVLSVDYRQLPKGKLEDSLADACDAYAWLVAQGVAGDRIVCVGDSAGGHLAFAVALHARKLGIEGPAGVVGLSPWLDFDIETKMGHPNAARDVMIPPARLAVIGRLCTGSDVIAPHSSPINRVLAGLPPVLIQCAEDELLRHDAELMAERLAAAGVQYRLQIWQGQVHAFPVLGHALPESRAAISEVVSFVTEVLQAA